MKKQSASRSAFFNPRVLIGFVLLLFGLSIGLLAQGPRNPAAFASSNNMPPARQGMGMAYDAAREQVVLFGGGLDCCSGNYFNDTWVWDGTTWTQVFPVTSPPARTNISLAYDAQRAEVVLFGGRGVTAELSDTWTWDGTTWTEQHPSAVPPIRDAPGLAYDTQRGKVVMFSGYQGCFHCNPDDTWTWDGVTWTQESPTRSPSGRDSMGMVYDALRGKVVLFGGVFFPTTYNDTFTWNGSNWRRESPSASPPVRAYLAMAYDEVRGNAVIFGGNNIPTFLNDTWEWDGATWAQRFPATSPSARNSSAMAFDAVRGRVVLFGGQSPDGTPLGDTWTWDGTTWLLQAPTTQDCLQPPTGLVSWWSGDRTAEDVQGTNNGTLLNGASFRKGMVGPAFSFDGVDDYVSIPDNDSLNPGLSDFTFEFWVNTTDTTNGYILDKRSGCGASSFYNVHIDVSGGIVFEIMQDIAGNNYNDLHSPVSINDGAWHHVAVVRQGVTASIYTDGVASTSASTEGITNISNSHALTIGTGSCNLQFGGRVDELTYYNSALSASTVAAIYSADSAGKCKPEIFVSSIDPSYQVRGRGFLISTSIVIQDENGIGIEDALVQIKATLPSGSVLDFPATTDATGQAIVSFATQDSGLYKFKVRKVTHPTRKYDPSLNIETSDTLLIP